MNMLEAPPGILDLIPLHPSSDDHQEEAFDLQPRLWSQLPEHLLHSVLARLPFQSILRFRSVCMHWKTLFGSPTFHHLPSHRTHIPPWIFFIATITGSALAEDGHDDNGYIFEGDKHCDGGTDDGSYMNASDDSRNAHDDHGDMYDAMRCDDNGDMHDVTRCGDHGDTHGVDARNDDHVNDSKKAHEELLLIFDCTSESWRPPLRIPPGFKAAFPEHFFSRFDVCSFQEQVLIPTFSHTSRLLLFNPASPSHKVLPPSISMKKLEGLGLSEESSTISRSGTSMSLSNLSALSNESRNVEQFLQGTMAKVLQVVAVGETGKGTYVVESFNSTTGTWRICGYLLQSHHTVFMQRRMVFFKGSFYAKVSGGILKLDNVLGGQNMKCTFREFPSPPNENDSEAVIMMESRLIGTKDSMFLVGVNTCMGWETSEDWDVVIWQFLPHAPENVCWQLLAYTPKSILDNFYGDIHISNIDSFAHGDLIFFQVPDRQRFLIYDMRQKLWRFSAKCKYPLDSMTFVWEPILRN